MAVWPTHRKRVDDRTARVRWARRQSRLARRARRVKPNDTARVKVRPAAPERP